METIVYARHNVNTTVAWFNEKKGYGFVNLARPNNAFVHVTTLQQSGFSSTEMKRGAAVTVDYVVHSSGKLQVTEVHQIDSHKRPPAELRRVIDHKGDYCIVQVSFPRDPREKPKYEVRLNGSGGTLVEGNLHKSEADDLAASKQLATAA